MADILDGRNNGVLHEIRFLYPEERNCIVRAIHTNSPLDRAARDWD